MNTPDDFGCYPELQMLPRTEEDQVFAEPWQAQAFALAVRLSAQGHFTWKEWADALAAELAAAVERCVMDAVAAVQRRAFRLYPSKNSNSSGRGVDSGGVFI